MQLFHKFITRRFMCGSTCFGRLHAHHQELITALTASGFTVGALVVAALMVVVWLVTSQTTTINAATTNAPNGETRGC
jgi:hypothetical protein